MNLTNFFDLITSSVFFTISNQRKNRSLDIMTNKKLNNFDNTPEYIDKI